ncbi:hypothetical protein GCM10028857_03260 [Salinarchaeum chitinilyticum]
MGQTFRYKHGVFEVVLIEAENGVRQWDETACGCEEYHELSVDPRKKSPEEQRCKHIRQAILYHQLNQKVEPGNNPEEVHQSEISQYQG